ncbi:MAG TPA: RNA methyltransferase [Fimbriimonadaceae bacterium]|nr:RNA methyltransferase [Fimbriimonadaceae bacterium]
MARHPGHAPDPRHSSALTLESLRLLLDRPERNRRGLFWAEGCRSFFSALENGWPIRTVVYCPKLLHSRQTWRALETSAADAFLKVSPEEFHLLTRRSEPDGIGVVCEQRWLPLIEQTPDHGDLWVALDSARTPGNLGTILRTCAATGVRGVMLIGGEADPYDASAIRSSMGAIFSVPLIRTSARSLAGWKVRRDVLFVGATPNTPLDYRRGRYRTPLVLMMGSERSGLRDRQIALCDRLVRLPMTAKVDSLNLAVATSLMLYEVRRAEGG